MRRLIVIAALATGIVIGATAPVGAAPGGGAGQYTVPMVCDGQTVTLTIASGRWSAAYVVETDSKFIPKGTYVAVTNVETGELLFEEFDAKPSVTRAGSTCVDAWEDEGVLITFEVYGKLK